MHVDLLAAPRRARTPTRAELWALVRDLVDADTVTGPCALSVRTPGTDRLFPELPDDFDVCYYRGDDPESLLGVLAVLPAGRVDCYVRFGRLDRENPLVTDGGLDARMVSVGIVTLADPTVVACHDHEGTVRHHTVAGYLHLGGRRGVHTLDDTVLEPIVHRHFGSDAIVDASWS